MDVAETARNNMFKFKPYKKFQHYVSQENSNCFHEYIF